MARKKRLTTQAVIRASAVQYGISPVEMVQRTRKREILQPRQVAQYLSLRYKTGMLRQIAKETGVKQHGTVLHSFHTMSNEVELYEDRRDDVNEIILRLSLLGYQMQPNKLIDHE